MALKGEKEIFPFAHFTAIIVIYRLITNVFFLYTRAVLCVSQSCSRGQELSNRVSLDLRLGKFRVIYRVTSV